MTKITNVTANDETPDVPRVPRGFTFMWKSTLHNLLEGYRRDAEVLRKKNAAQAETILQRERTIAERDQAFADLETRLRHVLAVEELAQANLEQLFGELDDRGKDPTYLSHYYSATSTYADIEVTVIGRVIITDPKKKINRIVVTFDPLGQFSEGDLGLVEEFLGRVMRSRVLGRGPVTKLSLTAAAKQKSTDGQGPGNSLPAPAMLHPGIQAVTGTE